MQLFEPLRREEATPTEVVGEVMVVDDRDG